MRAADAAALEREYAAMEMEQEAEHARQVRLAQLLSASAERWRGTLSSTPMTKMVISMFAATMFAATAGEMSFLVLSMAWVFVQALLKFLSLIHI